MPATIVSTGASPPGCRRSGSTRKAPQTREATAKPSTSPGNSIVTNPWPWPTPPPPWEQTGTGITRTLLAPLPGIGKARQRDSLSRNPQAPDSIVLTRRPKSDHGRGGVGGPRTPDTVGKLMQCSATDLANASADISKSAGQATAVGAGTRQMPSAAFHQFSHSRDPRPQRRPRNLRVDARMRRVTAQLCQEF